MLCSATGRTETSNRADQGLSVQQLCYQGPGPETPPTPIPAPSQLSREADLILKPGVNPRP